MMINSHTLMSITEANQNFSKVARLVEEQGAVVILKNNMPRYLVVEFSQAEQMQSAGMRTSCGSRQGSCGKSGRPMKSRLNEDPERAVIDESGDRREVIRLISARLATNFERGVYYGKHG